MDEDKGRPPIGNWFAASAIALAIGLVLVVVLLFTGALLDAADDLVTVLLAAVAGLAVAGWWQDKLARAERDREQAAARRQEESEREQQAREREREDKAREAQQRRQEEEHKRDLQLRARLERAHTAEREWARDLREQVSRLHREKGALGHSGDVRELVLQTAVRLVEADRGLLLSREDQDGDGDFDMVCSTGFTSDPAHSAVAQEYADRVLRHDETVREDDSSELRGDGRNDADEEIHNLLAIPIYIQDQFSGVVLCANREDGFDDLDDDVLLALGDHAGAVLENGRLHGELRTSYVATVRMLAGAIEAKDPSTRVHSEEVADYVGAVADQLDIEPRRREELLIGSLLHDVGKIGISERILLKPGPLTPEERDAIELHPGIGFRLVRQVPALEGIAPAVLHHHERYDGNGYPAGLAGDGIPLEARVIGVADSFSAMTAARPYREPLSIEQACSELHRCAGTQFDPRVVDLFVEEVRKHPPGSRSGGTDRLDSALDDPAVRAQLAPGEPVVGHGTIGAVDNLTLLYSHRHLHEVAADLAEQAAVARIPFSMLLVELTELAEINARDGFSAGDRAIVETARAASRVAARCGGTACRYGGRRLAVLAPATTEEAAAALGRDLELELNGGGPAVRAAAAAWRPGDPSAAVIARARMALAAHDLETPPAAR
ncbi:MAG: HD domain-containing phosphohydrolase [Thermoleophilaceae bacterium]